MALQARGKPSPPELRAMGPFKPFLPEPLITFSGRSAMDGLYPYRPFTFASAPLRRPIQECRTVFYTPSGFCFSARIENQVLTLFAAFSYLVEAANQRHQGKEDFLVTRRSSPLIELLIVDEANRLKDAGLEQIRDFAIVESLAWFCSACPAWRSVCPRSPTLFADRFCS